MQINSIYIRAKEAFREFLKITLSEFENCYYFEVKDFLLKCPEDVTLIDLVKNFECGSFLPDQYYFGIIPKYIKYSFTNPLDIELSIDYLLSDLTFLNPMSSIEFKINRWKKLNDLQRKIMSEWLNYLKINYTTLNKEKINQAQKNLDTNIWNKIASFKDLSFEQFTKLATLIEKISDNQLTEEDKNKAIKLFYLQVDSKSDCWFDLSENQAESIKKWLKNFNKYDYSSWIKFAE